MNKREMVSSSLTKLNGTVRDLINSGIWFLYDVTNDTNDKAKYCLSADQTYLLAEDGSVLNKYSVMPPDLQLGASITFTDIPKPNVEKNFSLSWAY